MDDPGVLVTPGGRRAFGQVTYAQRPAGEGVSGVRQGWTHPPHANLVELIRYG